MSKPGHACVFVVFTQKTRRRGIFFGAGLLLLAGDAASEGVNVCYFVTHLFFIALNKYIDF
jgi:hypothetical protein